MLSYPLNESAIRLSEKRIKYFIQNNKVSQT